MNEAKELSANSLKSLLDTCDIRNTEVTYNVPIGTQINGQIFKKDFADIPHILITGFRGAGKTSFVQTVLSCFVETHDSEHLKVGIFNSKTGDYKAFDGLPHLLFPIIDDCKKACEMLQWASLELEKRLELFTEAGVKNYAEYNEAHKLGKESVLPQLFIVLDDYYELQDYEEATDALINLSTRGSMAGIHCIIVTAVSSSKTLIKDIGPNIPYRINFCVVSRSASKFSVSHIGADNLYSPGEIIYRSPNELVKCRVFYIPYDVIQARNQAICLASRKSLDKISDKAVGIFDEAKCDYSNSNTVDVTKHEVLLSNAPGTGRLEKTRKTVSEEESEKQNGLEKRDSIPHLRPFDLFTIKGGNISVYNDKIHLSFRVFTHLGPGITNTEFTGNAIMALIFKKPGHLFPGYLQFKFKSSADLDNENPDLLNVNISNVSQIMKLEVARNDERIAKMFLTQLSEDIGIPVTVV